MQGYYNTRGKQLTYPERRLIERWYNHDLLSRREIAKRLGKAHQTISNEIKRGQVDMSFNSGGLEYSADIAQENYNNLRGAVGTTDTWTPDKNIRIKAGILNKVSPKIIAQEDMPCCSTIYKWIYKGWVEGVERKHLLYPRKEKKQEARRSLNRR